ncbi:MAG: hypothetical protein WED10_11040 [Brumimicrobium sp.]
MSAYHSHQEITNRLKALSDQLSKGDLSEDELIEFETLSRRLYERAIVLNYKAKEANVYSKKESKKEQVIPPVKEVEAEGNSSKKEEKPTPKPQKEVVGEIAFDFSSDEDAPQTTGNKDQKSNLEAEENNITNNVQEKQVEKAKNENNKKEVPETKNIEDPEISSFFERFTQVHDDSLMGKLGSAKINSLKGSIGLNDKLQFISELFAGNSELFNKAIDILDNQESNENARYQLSEIAAEQSWDAESPIVEEFVKIIDRRYAD